MQDELILSILTLFLLSISELLPFFKCEANGIIHNLILLSIQGGINKYK